MKDEDVYLLTEGQVEELDAAIQGLAAKLDELISKVPVLPGPRRLLEDLETGI